MKRTTRIKLATATAATAAAAVLGVAVLPTAQAADETHGTATAAGAAVVGADGKGIPSEVAPATDLSAHTPGSEPMWNDSIYFTSEVKANGHDYGILVHTMNFPNIDKRTLAVSVTDRNTGWYKNYEPSFSKGEYSWSANGLDIKMPGLTWTGDEHKMSVKTTTPWGALDVQLKAKGPVMKYAGTGAFSLLGEPNYEFAFPSMDTTGTLTVQGRTHKISGESWLDRQWGPIPQSDTMRWTWMNLDLSNGDKVAIWDAVDGEAENSWATVMHPDGSYDLAAVKPVADGADEYWSSPTTGKTYPTRWHVEIPALKADLTVRLAGTAEQELTHGLGGRIEGTASFTGTYEGKKVSGENYVEMAANWTR